MKHQHVLCIYPYRKPLKGYGLMPPIGLEHIAAAIEDLVESITIIDMRFEEDVSSFIKDTTSLICVSINWQDEEEDICELINQLPPHILTVVGGRYATINVEEFFAACPNIDIIARGDGEEIMRDVAIGRPLEEIAGISFRRNGEIIHNTYRHLDVVSDTVYPNRRLRRYVYRLSSHGYDLGHTVDFVASSRGCPYNCKFCTFNMNPYGGKRNWSARSAESVVKEIGEIDADLVLFTDDNFSVDMERVGAICDLINERGIRKKFLVQSRIEIASRPDVLQKMEDAGFVALLLGIESPHDRILRQLNKGITQQQIRDAFQVFSQFDRILYHGFFIFGNIGETEEEMKYISTFAREIGVDAISLSILRCDRYSPLREIIDAADGYHIEPGGDIYSDQYSKSKLRGVQHWILRDFYSPLQVVGLARKMIQIGFVDRQTVFSFIRAGLDQCRKKSRKRRDNRA